MKQLPNSLSNPFMLTDDEIREFAGDTTLEELRCVRAVLNGIRDKLHNVSMNNGMTHSESCWSFGPAHFACAYNLIVKLSRERPALTDADLRALSAQLQIDVSTVTAVAKAVEKIHLIGVVR